MILCVRTDTDPGKLQLVHRHGPCSPLKNKRTPSHKQVLADDQSRANYLQLKNKRSSLPAHTGSSLGTGNYIVSLGFGTPKLTQTVLFDTGSDVTWIQCRPCVDYCYPQKEPYFDPSKSTTYRNVSCSSPACAALDLSGCLDSTCLYEVDYGDKSKTVGFLAQDTLTLSSASADTVPGFLFGCGEQNSGLFGRVAGLLGLGRQPTSFVSQTAAKYGGVFSYCLPSSSSSTGYLTFGGSPPSGALFTPMLSLDWMPTFYFLELQSILVGGRRLPLSPALFSDAGVFLDSGTVITRLPPTAYSALRRAFRQGMAHYPMSPAAGILDTCYDFRKNKTVTMPTVVLQYRGVAASLPIMGTLYPMSTSQVCLAFAANGDDGDLVIIGNTQQKGFSVVYDVGRELIGFGPGGC